MKKQILSEVNRAREIMGLGQLIIEGRKEYLFKSRNVTNTEVREIENFLPRYSNYSNIQQIPGYTDIADILGKRNADKSGSPIKAQDVIVALIERLGGGKITRKAVKRFAQEQLLNTRRPRKISVEVKNIPVPKIEGEYVLTQGKVSPASTSIDTTQTNKKTFIPRLVKYLNGFNFDSYPMGGPEWDLEAMTPAKSLELRQGPTGQDEALLLYSTKIGQQQEAETEREEVEDIEKGYEATGRYQTDYAAGDSNPQSNLVDKAVMEIMQMFPADIAKDMDEFNLQAGASANWGGNKLPNSQGKGNSGFAEGDEGKNQRLAFERGDKFMKAVNQKLKANGHPGFDNYMVNWIVQGQSKSDQFIDLMLKVDKEDKIKTTTIVTGKLTGDKERKAESGTIAQFVFLLGV